MKSKDFFSYSSNRVIPQADAGKAGINDMNRMNSMNRMYIAGAGET